MNGFNQKARSVYCNWYNNVLEADAQTYVTEVTSATDATLTLDNSLVRTTATKFTGCVSLVCNGKGTYTLANLLSTSTGTLTVGEGFTVGFKWNAGWSGDAVVKSGGKLGLDSAMAFIGKKSCLSVEPGGVLELGENAVVELSSLHLGDRKIPGGEYTQAAFVEAGLGDFVTGSGTVVVAEDSGTAVRGTNARDGLLYELLLTDTTADGEWASAECFSDGATWSAKTPYQPYGLCKFNPDSDQASYGKYGTPDPLAVKEFEIPVAYFSKLNVCDIGKALCFPKNVRTYDNGDGSLSTNLYRLGVCYKMLPGALHGSNLTVRLRFRWDGNVQQPTPLCYDQYIMQLYNKTKKLNALSLTVETYHPTTQAENGYLRFNLGDSGLYDTQALIKTNVWYDVFYSIRGMADGKSKVTVGEFLLSAEGNGIMDRKAKEMDAQLGIGPEDAGYMYLGCDSSLFGGSATQGEDKWYSSLDSQSLRSFNGAIAKLEIYDHAMTIQEMNAVMHEPGSGCTFKIGSQNASADEFAALDDPQAADIFDPRTDSVRSFRKELTAENPSAVIRFAMKPEEKSLPRTLRLCMDCKNIISSAPVEIAVNGVAVETVDFRKTRSALIFLQPRFMRPDSNGYLTITLTRPAGCTGSLLFDTVELSGSWAAGVADKSSSDWCFCSSDKFFHSLSSYWDKRWALPGGKWDRTFVPHTIYGWRKDRCDGGQPIVGQLPYIPTAQFAFDVPSEVIEQGGGTLTIGSASTNSRVELDVFANNVNVGHVNGVEQGASYVFRLPPEVLVNGLNSLVVSNSGANFAESSANNSYNSFTFDFIRFTAEVPPRLRGMMIICR